MEPKGPARVERRLAAILAADVAGYSRLRRDEEGTRVRVWPLSAYDAAYLELAQRHRQPLGDARS